MPIRSHFASKQAALSGAASRSASASVQSEFQKSPRFLDLEDWRDQLMREASENVQLKLGDASIASPFTCKSTGIDKGNSRNRPFFLVLQILRFGRCTLVTTFQIYIILALNSLIGAYSMSVLYMDGVKNGDLYDLAGVSR